MTDIDQLYRSINEEIDKILVGNDDLIERLTISLFTGGHVLLEGVPGVAKTTVANAFSRTTGLSFNRIQMTPDILPADVTGTHVYRENEGEFELQRGPIFANIVVVDEINRATPKTQSALLEAMQEEQVTIEGDTIELPTPFMVIATQNPIEMEGTFELPEAQRDRFQFKHVIDLPDAAEELDLIDQFDSNPSFGPEDVDQVIPSDAIGEARDFVADVYADDRIKSYIRELVAATRDNPSVEFGASPRTSLFLISTAKARAAIHGREYVLPDDLKTLLRPVLSHRLILTTDAELSDVTADDVIDEILKTLEPPGSEPSEAFEARGDGENLDPE